MSAYNVPGNNTYSHNPHPALSQAHALPHHQNLHVPVPSAGSGNNDPLSAHSHTSHGLPAGQQQIYQYDHPSAPQQLQSPYNHGHTNGHGHGHAEDGPQSASAPAPANGAEGQKGNRLRKACDSCSIRKVKVGLHPCARRNEY